MVGKSQVRAIGTIDYVFGSKDLAADFANTVRELNTPYEPAFFLSQSRSVNFPHRSRWRIEVKVSFTASSGNGPSDLARIATSFASAWFSKNDVNGVSRRLYGYAVNDGVTSVVNTVVEVPASDAQDLTSDMVEGEWVS